MNKESSWLLDKAAKEDGAQVSVGGLIGDIEAMGKGLADCKVTGHTEPFTLSGIQIYTWPSDYGFYRPQVKPLTGQPRESNPSWLNDALQAAQELAIKEKEAKAAKQAKQAADYLDPEVDKLEKKLKDIQSKIETARKQKQRRKENQAKIDALKKQIEEAEKLLSKENEY